MNRDELARAQWVGVPLSQEVLKARREEWDLGLVSEDDMAECYARADRMIADGEVPA